MKNLLWYGYQGTIHTWQRARTIRSIAGTVAVDVRRPWQRNRKVEHPTGIFSIGTLGGVRHVGGTGAGWRVARPACVSVHGEDLLRGPDRTKWTVVSYAEVIGGGRE